MSRVPQGAELAPAFRSGLERASQAILHAAVEPADWELRALSQRASGGVTLARTTPAWGTGSDGRLYRVNEDFARFEWHDLDGDGILERPALVCEDASDNLCGHDDVLSSWVVTGAGSSVALAGALGDCDLWTFTDGDAASAATLHKVLAAFTGLTRKGVLVVWAKHPTFAASGNFVRLRDNTGGVNLLNATILANADGSPNPSIVGGLGNYLGSRKLGPVVLPTGQTVIAYLLAFDSNAVTNVGNTHHLQLGAAVTASQTGSAIFGGVLVENAVRPSSRIETAAGVSVTRAREVIGWEARGVDLLQPESWVIDLVETGGVGIPNGIVALCSDSNGALPAMYVEATGTVYRVVNATPSASVLSAAPSPPTYGKWIRLLVTRFADGSVQIGQSIDGGQMAFGTKSGALTNPVSTPGGGGTSVGYYLQPSAGFGGARTRLLEWWAVPGAYATADLVTRWW